MAPGPCLAGRVVSLDRQMQHFRKKEGGVCGGTTPVGSSSLAFAISRMKLQSVIYPPVMSVRPQQPASI